LEHASERGDKGLSPPCLSLGVNLVGCPPTHLAVPALRQLVAVSRTRTVLLPESPSLPLALALGRAGESVSPKLRKTQAPTTTLGRRPRAPALAAPPLHGLSRPDYEPSVNNVTGRLRCGSRHLLQLDDGAAKFRVMAGRAPAGPVRLDGGEALPEHACGVNERRAVERWRGTAGQAAHGRAAIAWDLSVRSVTVRGAKDTLDSCLIARQQPLSRVSRLSSSSPARPASLWVLQQPVRPRRASPRPRLGGLSPGASSSVFVALRQAKTCASAPALRRRSRRGGLRSSSGRSAPKVSKGRCGSAESASAAQARSSRTVPLASLKQMFRCPAGV
jgi:hypothetical protein